MIAIESMSLFGVWITVLALVLVVTIRLFGAMRTINVFVSGLKDDRDSTNK
jgi:hypothetical protein